MTTGSFLTLAEELHSRRTSERLGVAQGRVSQTIKKLERRIGAPLRDDMLPRHLQIQRAITDARTGARALTETLRVGFSPPCSAARVIQAADILRAHHPRCQVHITEVQLADPFGPLRAGQLDLQLSEWPVREPDLTCGPLVLTEPRALIVPAGHSLAGRASISLEDLAEVELITIGGDVPAYWLEAHFPALTPSGRTVANGQSVTYWQEVAPLIAAGRGVSTAGFRAAEYHSQPDLVFVPYHDAPPIALSAPRQGWEVPGPHGRGPRRGRHHDGAHGHSDAADELDHGVVGCSHVATSFSTAASHGRNAIFGTPGASANTHKRLDLHGWNYRQALACG